MNDTEYPVYLQQMYAAQEAEERQRDRATNRLIVGVSVVLVLVALAVGWLVSR